MSDAKPYSAGDVPDTVTCTDCGEPDCCLMEEQARIRATVEALEQAEAALKEWGEKDGNSPGYNLEKARTYGRIAAEQKARAEKAEAERDERTEQFRRAARIANELTLETQTPEEWTADLVRQVRQARAERDALQRRLAVAERCVYDGDALAMENATLRAERDEARAKCAALREALVVALKQGWFGIHSSLCYSGEPYTGCTCPPWVQQARAALATDGEGT